MQSVFLENEMRIPSKWFNKPTYTDVEARDFLSTLEQALKEEGLNNELVTDTAWILVELHKKNQKLSDAEIQKIVASIGYAHLRASELIKWTHNKDQLLRTIEVTCPAAAAICLLQDNLKINGVELILTQAKKSKDIDDLIYILTTQLADARKNFSPKLFGLVKSNALIDCLTKVQKLISSQEGDSPRSEVK